MSNNAGPEGVAPDHLRCRAMVRGKKLGFYYEWTRHDHQCPNKAYQFRQDILVCHVHKKCKKLEPWKEKKDAY